MRVPKLAEKELQGCLAALPAWTRQENAIQRTYVFQSFREAMAFVSAVADAAEAADHHPDMDIRYRKVTLALTTHDAGGLTVKDMALAARADGLAV